MARYLAIDKLRGLLILNMGLGHSIAFSTGKFNPELWYDRTPSYTDIAAFFIRFINHSATPMFFMIMGLSMALFRIGRLNSGWSEGRVVGFFIRRGLLLIAIQFTIINAGWSIGEGQLAWKNVTLGSLFDPRGRWLYFGVLFALGTSMLLVSLLLRVRTSMLLGLGIFILISPHIYLLYVDYSPGKTNLPTLLGPLAIPGRWPNSWVLYTTIPWIGLTLLGVVLGRLLARDRELFGKLVLRSGIVLVSLFLVLKLGQYLSGDYTSLINLLHMTRYPPDLILLVYSIGVNFLLISMFSKIELGPLDVVLVTFGRTALFLYLLQLFVYGAIATLTGRNVELANAAANAVLGLLFLFPLCWVYLHFLRPTKNRCFSATVGYISRKWGQLGTANQPK